MVTAPLYNLQGERVRDMELNDVVFGVKPKAAVVHQVYVALRANKRAPLAHTKDRGDVRGGGKKPWKQKGTGRARHGSIRSPLWRGGGVTFGPTKDRNYTQKINRKMNQIAVRMCLSDKVAHEKFLILDGISAEEKTSRVVRVREGLPGAGKSTLLLIEGTKSLVIRAVRNIPRMSVQYAIDVNVSDLLDHQYVISTPDAVLVLEKRLRKDRV